MTTEEQIESILAKHVNTQVYREMTKAITLLTKGLVAMNTEAFMAYKSEISAKYADHTDIRADFTTVCRLVCDCVHDYAASKLQLSI